MNWRENENNLWFLLLFGALFMLLQSCGSKSPSHGKKTDTGLTKVTLQTDWYAQAEHGGFYQAITKGFFEEEGLEVEIVQGGPNAFTIERISIGQAQFSIGRSDEVSVYIGRGVPLLILGSFMQKDPQAIMFHKSSGIENFKDLDGKSIMAVPGSNFVSVLEGQFDIDINIIPSDYGMDRFLADQDFIQQCFITNEPYYVSKAGAEPGTLLLSDSGFSPYRVFYARRDFALKNPEIVKGFTRASVKGWIDYLFGDPTEANRIIASQNSKMTEEFMAFSHSQMIEHNLITGDHDGTEMIGIIEAERIQTQLDQLLEIGVLEKPLEVEDVYMEGLFPELEDFSPTPPPGPGEPQPLKISYFEGLEGTVTELEYDLLINHPEVETHSLDLELRETPFEAKGLKLAKVIELLDLDPTETVAFGECSDLYQANYDPEVIERNDPLVVLSLDGVSVQEWAFKQDNPGWGPFIFTVLDYEGLVDPVHKKPWGVHTLGVASADSGTWQNNWLSKTTDSKTIALGQSLYEGSCMNCHAVNEEIGGTLSTRNRIVLTAFAMGNPGHITDMLADPYGKLPIPTAQKMPKFTHYSEEQKTALIDFLKVFN